MKLIRQNLLKIQLPRVQKPNIPSKSHPIFPQNQLAHKPKKTHPIQVFETFILLKKKVQKITIIQVLAIQ